MYIQTSDIKTLAAELNSLLHDYIVDKGIFTPVGKNVIKYKGYYIKKSNDELWAVYYNSKPIAETFLKTSAFVFCKLHESNNHLEIKHLLLQDKEFKKQFIDSKYFEYVIKNSQDEVSKDTALWRYEISTKKAEKLRKKINNTLYRLIV